MSISQRKLLVWSLAIGALLLHFCSGSWQSDNSFADIPIARGGWVGSGENAMAYGVALPIAMLVAAAFFYLGGRQRPVSNTRT